MGVSNIPVEFIEDVVSVVQRVVLCAEMVSIEVVPAEEVPKVAVPTVVLPIAVPFIDVGSRVALSAKVVD